MERDRTGRSKSKFYVNVGGLIATCILVFFLYRYLSSSGEDKIEHREHEVSQKRGKSSGDAEIEHPQQKSSTGKSTDADAVPDSVMGKIKEVTVLNKEITFKVGDQSVTVHYRDALPLPHRRGDHSVLFMHGAKYSSKTWAKIKSLQLVAAMGYRAVAVDLPGFGLSKKAHIEKKREFVQEFINVVDLNRPVLITASMSGGYALPFVFQPDAATCTDRVRGFVPIAPAATTKFSQSDYSSCKVPTMIVYGERDTGAPVDTLRQMPNSKVFMIKNAGHACYLDDTDEWHRLLYNFLRSPNAFRS